MVRAWVLDEIADRPWPFVVPSQARGGAGAGNVGVGEAVDIPLVAYHDWANRGPSTMRVWLPMG
jgi:hypothetical protein